MYRYALLGTVTVCVLAALLCYVEGHGHYFCFQNGTVTILNDNPEHFHEVEFFDDFPCSDEYHFKDNYTILVLEECALNSTFSVRFRDNRLFDRVIDLGNGVVIRLITRPHATPRTTVSCLALMLFAEARGNGTAETTTGAQVHEHEHA